MGYAMLYGECGGDWCFCDVEEVLKNEAPMGHEDHIGAAMFRLWDWNEVELKDTCV